MLDSPSKLEPDLAPTVSAVVKTEPKDTTAASNPPIVPPPSQHEQQVAKSEESEAPVPSSEQVVVAPADAPSLQPPVLATSEQAATASGVAPSLSPPIVQSEESNAPTPPVGEGLSNDSETLPKPPVPLNQDAEKEEPVPPTIVPLPTQPLVQLPTPVPPPAALQPSATNPPAEPAPMAVVPATSVKTEPGPEIPPVPRQPAPLLSATPVKTENPPPPAAIPQDVAPPVPAPPAAAPPAAAPLPPQSNATNNGPSPTNAAYAVGPPPRNLPKSCKHRPKNSRVFVGNLASEFTTPFEMVSIFHKYGELIEEPVLRRSFGFIQYGNPEAAKRAVVGEQGKIIGGIPIDLSIADNREVKRGTHVANNTPFPHGPKGKHHQRQMHHRSNNYGHNNHHNNHHNNRDNMNNSGNNMGSRKRRRSVSPGGGPIRRMGEVRPPQFRRSRPEPRNGIHMRILCMSGTAKNYARQCESMFRSETGLGCDIVQIVAAGLGEGLGKCMQNNIPYVLVVASKDVEDGTCTIRTLERTGYEKSGRGNGIISLREAVDVCLIDRGITPGRGGVGGQGGHLAMPNPYGGPQKSVHMVPAGWTQQPGGMQGGAQYPGRKPGWMSGPRAPPHPQNVGHHRGGPPPPPDVMDNNGPNAYNQSPMAAHQMPMAGRPPYPQPYNMQAPPGAPPIPDYQGAPGAPMQQQGGWPSGPGGYGPPPPPPHQDYSRGGHAMGGMGNPGNGNRNGGNEYDPTAVMTGGTGQPPPQDTGAYGGWQRQQQMGGGHAPMNGGGNSGNGRYMQQQNSYQPPQAYGAAPPQNYQQRPPPPASYNASAGSQGHGNTYPAYNQQPQHQNQRQQHNGGWASNQGPSQQQQQPGVAGNNQAARGGGNSIAPSVDFDKLTNLISVFQQRNDAPGSGGGGIQQNAPLLSQQPYGNNSNGNGNTHNHNRHGNNNQYNAYSQYQASPQQQTAQGHQSRYSRR